MNTRNAELAKIHIAKTDLAMDDATYRDMLWLCARVTSSKDLDHAGRAKVLDHLKSRGWKPKTLKSAAVKVKLLWKVDQLLKEQNLTQNYAEGIAKQMYKRAKLAWCTPTELRGIITALNNKLKADKQKAANG